jgi:formylglycine-generating enzyme required for sulfatase activity
MPISYLHAVSIMTLAILLAGCAAPDPTSAPVASTATASPTVTPTTTAAVTPTPTSIPEHITDPHGALMTIIPAGEFTMGSDQGFPDELPIHKVYLDAFYMDTLEVTNRQYQDCVEAGACTPPFRTDCCSMDERVPRPVYYGNPEFDDYPVTWLSWVQGKAYCDWRGARLPTEAEWEKAARGTDARIYPWGDEGPTPNRLNFTWKPVEFGTKPPYGTLPVGSYQLGASPYGILDMAGNVYEWVSDNYDPDYYAVSPHDNPQGPAQSKYRIARGGSFFNTAFRNRSSNRNYDAFLKPDLSEFDSGVRCAANVTVP